MSRDYQARLENLNKQGGKGGSQLFKAVLLAVHLGMMPLL